MAYEGLAKRTNHPGVKSVATAMIQAEQYGTPLGSALRTMAKENRELRLSAAEKKAAALPAKLTVPMILFFLPVLFVVILGPAIIKIQDTMASNAAKDVPRADRARRVGSAPSALSLSASPIGFAGGLQDACGACRGSLRRAGRRR